MNTLKGITIGEIRIIVYKTPEGEKLFKLNTNSEEVLPIVDILEDVLNMY